MKFLLVLLSFFLSGIAVSQNKLALIIAIGEYPQASKIRPIASVNDVKYIKTALTRNGFSEKNIDTLINSKATKAAILNSLAQLSEKAMARPRSEIAGWRRRGEDMGDGKVTYSNVASAEAGWDGHLTARPSPTA